MTTQTLLFHDFETWGVDPKRDFPSQFAAIRTDLDFNIIDKPINIFCKIPNDYLPKPEACLITGITPQQTLRDGLIEAEFIKKIHHQMSKANTCSLGYNSIRFDDEVTRFCLYRNFYDPYAREWQNGNSRWDLIDLVRATYALRPEGINWPVKVDGTPSFRLEDLTKANNLGHDNAHDALADVYATIAIAKLIKQKHPKLFAYYFNLRAKHEVAKIVNPLSKKAFVHVSAKIPSIQSCCSVYYPINIHPTNKNAIICIDLLSDISALEKLNAEEIRKKLYTRTDDLDEGESRPGLKLIHINKCPFVAPRAVLNQETLVRLNISVATINENVQYLSSRTDLVSLFTEVFFADHSKMNELEDVDSALYSSGFASNEEKQWMQQVINSEPSKLAIIAEHITEPRFAQRLFRYRARNFPNSLNENELVQWQRYRHHKFTDDSFNIAYFIQEIEQLVQTNHDNPRKLGLLKELQSFVNDL